MGHGAEEDRRDGRGRDTRPPGRGGWSLLCVCVLFARGFFFRGDFLTVQYWHNIRQHTLHALHTHTHSLSLSLFKLLGKGVRYNGADEVVHWLWYIRARNAGPGRHTKRQKNMLFYRWAVREICIPDTSRDA